MNKLRQLRLDLFFIFLLLSLSIFAWRQIPELVIRGDGFVYMVSSTLTEFFSRTYWYTGFEISAAILGSILPNLYKTNIALYFYTSLTFMMFINVVFYILLKVITKDKIISFFGALLFAVNYFGNFDMYSQHCYCFFMERIVAVPLLLASFIFLHLFLKKRKLLLYLISLAFYSFGIGIAHFTVLFTAPYLFYPLFWYLFKNKNKISKIKGLLIGGSYLLISGFFVLIQRIHESYFGPKLEFMEYFLKPHVTQYPEKIIRQLTYWSEYEPIVRSFDQSSLHRLFDVQNAISSTPYIISLYILIAFIIYKKLPSQRAILLTTIFGTATIFYLNAWFGQYDVLYQPGANRYLYFPTFLLVLFWTFFLLMLWRSKHKYMKLFALVFVLGYYLLNWLIIRDNFKDVLTWDRSTKVTYKHMTSMRPKLKKHTLVVAEYPEVGVYESKFFTEQIGRGEVRFLGEYHPYEDWRKIASVSAYVIMLRYEKVCDCVKEERIK